MSVNNLRAEAFKIRGISDGEVPEEGKRSPSAKKQLDRKSVLLDLEICGDHNLRERCRSGSDIDSDRTLRRYRKQHKEARKKATREMERDNEEVEDRILNKEVVAERKPTSTFDRVESSHVQSLSDVRTLRSMSDGSDASDCGEEMSFLKPNERASCSPMSDSQREEIINTFYKFNRPSFYSDSEHSCTKIPSRRKTLSKDTVSRSSHSKNAGIDKSRESAENTRSSKFGNIFSETRTESSSELPPYSRKEQQRRGCQGGCFLMDASDSEILDLENCRCDFKNEPRKAKLNNMTDPGVKEVEMIGHIVNELVSILKSVKSSEVTIAFPEPLDNVECTPVDKLEYLATAGNDQAELTIAKQMDSNPTIQEEGNIPDDDGNIADEGDNEQSQSSIISSDDIQTIDDDTESVNFDSVVLQKDAATQTPNLDLLGRADHLEGDCPSLISVASSHSFVSSQKRERLLHKSPPTTSHRLITRRTANGVKIWASETMEDDKGKSSEIRCNLTKEQNGKDFSLLNVNIVLQSSEVGVKIKMSPSMKNFTE